MRAGLRDRVPARRRQPSRSSAPSGGTDRLAARRASGAAARLPDHVLPQPPGRRREQPAAASRRGSCCSRTRRSQTRGTARCGTTSASRARGLRSRGRARPASLDVRIDDWSLRAGRRALPRAHRRTRVRARSRPSRATQPPLLQGEHGLQPQGPRREPASYYYSLPQLAGRGRVDARQARAQRSPAPRGSTTNGRARARADARGWDWIGINLDDGGALMAFRMRDEAGKRTVGGGDAARARRPRRRFRAERDRRGRRCAAGARRAPASTYPVRMGSACGRAQRTSLRALARRPGARCAREHRHDLLGRRVRASTSAATRSAAAISSSPATASDCSSRWSTPCHASIRTDTASCSGSSTRERLADRLEQVTYHTLITEEDREFIERSRHVLPRDRRRATGTRTARTRAAIPGFVRVLDERTLVFPNYDGNGMFLSFGNARVNPQRRPAVHRLRARATAFA